MLKTFHPFGKQTEASKHENKNSVPSKWRSHSSQTDETNRHQRTTDDDKEREAASEGTMVNNATNERTAFIAGTEAVQGLNDIKISQQRLHQNPKQQSHQQNKQNQHAVGLNEMKLTYSIHRHKSLSHEPRSE